MRIGLRCHSGTPTIQLPFGSMPIQSGWGRGLATQYPSPGPLLLRQERRAWWWISAWSDLSPPVVLGGGSGIPCSVVSLTHLTSSMLIPLASVLALVVAWLMVVMVLLELVVVVDSEFRSLPEIVPLLELDPLELGSRLRPSLELDSLELELENGLLSGSGVRALLLGPGHGEGEAGDLGSYSSSLLS